MRPDWHLVIGHAPALPAMAQRVQALPPLARVAVIVAGSTHAARCLHAGVAEPYVICCDDAGMQCALRALYIPDGCGMVTLYGEAATCAGIRAILAQRTGPTCWIEQQPSKL